jgi:hypothetical protein
MVPYFILGRELSLPIWRSSWPAALIFFGILLGFDVFYALNGRLFLLLEREDWPALAQYLEDRVLRKGRYSPRLVRILADTYLVLSDSAAVISLENKLAIVKPALVEANALIFAAARILGGDYAGAVRFLEERLKAGGARNALWLRWYYGFALLLDRRFSPAADEFAALALDAPEAVVTGLAAYFLTGTLGRALPERRLELTAAAMDGRSRLKKAFPRKERWDKEVARIGGDVYTVILSKYITETTGWLFG